MTLGVPIVRLELEGLKTCILAALESQAGEFTQMAKEALNEFCSEGHVRDLVRIQVRAEVERAIKDEIRAFYSYGEGRKAVHEAVIKRLQADSEWL